MPKSPGHLIEIIFNLSEGGQYIRTQVTPEEAFVIERTLRSPALRGCTLHDTDGSLIFVNSDRVSHVTFTPVEVAQKEEWDD